MAMKEKQHKKQKYRFKQDECEHPKLEWSELTPEAERRRREKHRTKVDKERNSVEKQRRRAERMAGEGRWAGTAQMAASMMEAQRLLEGSEFEKNVADETDARWTSIEFHCPDCGLHGDIDVVTSDGTAKECKAGGQAVDQLKKNIVAAAIIFPGAAVHLAVPASQAQAAQASYRNSGNGGLVAGDKLQRH
jgi:hypothetical protein